VLRAQPSKVLRGLEAEPVVRAGDDDRLRGQVDVWDGRERRPLRAEEVQEGELGHGGRSEGVFRLSMAGAPRHFKCKRCSLPKGDESTRQPTLQPKVAYDAKARTRECLHTSPLSRQLEVRSRVMQSTSYQTIRNETIE
jgi:hypothetical protein